MAPPPVYPIERRNPARRITILAVPLIVLAGAYAASTYLPDVPGITRALVIVAVFLVALWMIGTWQVAWKIEITATQVTVWPVWRRKRTLRRSQISRARPTASALMLTGSHRFRGRIQVPSNRLLGLDDELTSIAKLWPATAAA